MATIVTESNTSVPSDVTETTFTKYTAKEANIYNDLRPNYHSSVYDHILDYHKSTGGKFDALVDVGCGPGMVTRSLATHFIDATGIDPSPELLKVADGHPDKSSNTTFAAASAGTFCPSPIAPGSASLITTANAAHWFPSMATFYARASTALQPGGTLAIWTTGDIRAAPDMPNSAAIQAAMDYHIDVEMKDYRDKGNALVRGGYRDLDLPWSSQGKGEEDLSNDFDEGSFVRREWKITEMFLDSKKIDERGASLKMVEMMYGTGSAVTRWREAHPEKANTPEDPVKRLVAQLGALLREAGVKAGEERLKGTAAGVVLLFKKRMNT